MGDTAPRLFLVRFRANDDPIANGSGFHVYGAVNDGTGNFVPATTSITNYLNAHHVDFDIVGGASDLSRSARPRAPRVAQGSPL